jgi:predicted phosphodiesterase
MTDILKQIESLKDQPLKDNLARVIENASTRLNDTDYPDLAREFTSFYSAGLSKEVFPAIIRITIPEPAADINLTNQELQRIVIIGDIHSDFNSLSSILKKLAASSFDYFTKSIIIFCGDYTDRGRRPFETLRLLYALKTYMGDRCILLKGNHEIIKYSCSMLRPTFYPADTTDLMNRVLNPEVNNLYYNYLSKLPYLVSLGFHEKKYLICHGSIPRHDYAAFFNEDKLAECLLPVSDHSKEGIMLNQMMWGDPGDNSSTFRGTETRFEFSKAEFLGFLDKHGYDILIRGHQPVDNGVMFCYNNRLMSLFSSGGHNNPDSFYPDDVANPAFVIINEEGELLFEKVF